jgi:hypothetical protein
MKKKIKSEKEINNEKRIYLLVTFCVGEVQDVPGWGGITQGGT